MSFLSQVQGKMKDLQASSFLRREDIKEIRQCFANRWDMLHRPMHAAAYLLHPFFLDDKGASTVSEIQLGWLETVSRLVPANEQKLVFEQMADFRAGRGPWTAINVKTVEGMSPLSFWETFYVLAPELAKVARRVMNLATTTSAAERNWSEYAFIHDKRRNRLRVDR